MMLTHASFVPGNRWCELGAGYIEYGMVCAAMWGVYEHSRADKSLDRLPLELLRRYEKWKDSVRISGPAGLRLIKGFRDEGLHGE